MKMNVVRLFAIVVVTVLAQPCQAINETLKIETIHGPPWGFIANDGRPTGMMYEIGNRIAEVAGLSYTNSLVPYPRTAADIENGSADMTIRFGNEQMTRGAVAVGIVLSMPIILVGPAGKNYSKLSELHGKTVGVVRTSNYVAQFDTDNLIQKYPVNDYLTMAKMLAMRRLDAGIGSSVGLFYGASMAGVKAEEIGVPLVLGSNDFIVFLSRKTARPETILALKEAIRKLSANGEMKQIMGKYTNSFSSNLPEK
ncbi:ABC transporter substrate-binding protein [Janthinobacterium sp. UMAB-56]|uniref:substrate-binding periplasmic protein n=1 Tax=Janthinobacterium sp. UMAB-56 TaxID=1365361 RepID=UPI001C560B07|nr:transporter substrate-binding domain-containing protein [Janthinobacterium sp. UMAB-56]